jgi:hypothetical protein
MPPVPAPPVLLDAADACVLLLLDAGELPDELQARMDAERVTVESRIGIVLTSGSITCWMTGGQSALRGGAHYDAEVNGG